MGMDEALQTFIAEARELLEQMEEALLRIEQMPDDAETINAIFRAAHTIKGSAGIFGLDYIVEFTHVAESVLDNVRSGKLPMTASLVAIFLAVCDHLGSLVTLVANHSNPDNETCKKSEKLLNDLHQYLKNMSAKEDGAEQDRQQKMAQHDQSQQTGVWAISLRIGTELLRHGIDPLSLLRYLTTLGNISCIKTISDGLPPLSLIDPESNYLSFDFKFTTEAELHAIDDAFEFIRDDAEIQITSLPDTAAVTAESSPQGRHLSAEDVKKTTQVKKEDTEKKTGKSNQSPSREQKSAEGGLIRVNADKLDEHINIIGELIIATASANLIAQSTVITELHEAAARLSKLVEEVRDSALNLRMVQIGTTFNRFQRIVRDVSADLGKDIVLEISGAETELDKTVVEKIGDPLTHLVRNSIDHGIESAEVRLARGKSTRGVVRLNAYHDSGSIVIEVSDDGGGLRKQQILDKAIEKNLVKADQVEMLSENDVFNLIFEPGFSTADEISNLSGRGVGMDVVRRNIAALRGDIEISSQEGTGTTIRIRLPLTLAIIDGFLVGVCSSSFVVPLDMVVECVELSEQEIKDAHGNNHLNLRGEVLPFIRLKELFNIPDKETSTASTEPSEAVEAELVSNYGFPSTLLTAEGAAALSRDPELRFLLHPVKRENVVVVQYAGRRAGLVVDQLKGEFQTVIRPLGEVFTGLDGISGFTILGNGNVALILDVQGLVRRVTDREKQLSNMASTPPTVQPIPASIH